MKRKNSVNISVDVSFYEKIERERKKFMKKNNLTKLSTRAFTGVLAKDFTGRKKK